MEKKQHSKAKLAVMQVAAGGCAGFIEVCIMHPLDLMKTRLQVQRGPDDPHRYSSLTDCVKKIYRNEGAMAFYKGILPPILAETPKRAVKFFTFEQFKTVFSFGSSPTPLTFAMAGVCAGITESFIINPFEVVKVTLQTQRHISLGEQKSTIATTREIVRQGGFGTRGLYKGITATLGRHSMANGIFFGFYHNVKNYVPEAKDPRMDFVRRFGIGFAAGCIAGTCNLPFDVTKSRIQGPQPVAGEIKYRTCMATMSMVYREEGFLALFKGFVPRVMRLGLGGGIMIVAFETAYKQLQNIL